MAQSYPIEESYIRHNFNKTLPHHKNMDYFILIVSMQYLNYLDKSTCNLLTSPKFKDQQLPGSYCQQNSYYLSLLIAPVPKDNFFLITYPNQGVHVPRSTLVLLRRCVPLSRWNPSDYARQSTSLSDGVSFFFNLTILRRSESTCSYA